MDCRAHSCIRRRDVTEELVTAARKGGVLPGLYFSNIDWFDADMRIDQWNAVASAGKLCNGIACDPKVRHIKSKTCKVRAALRINFAECDPKPGVHQTTSSR